MSEDNLSKQTVLIHTEWIRLDQLLKFCGEVVTGGEAKIKIEQGEVLVNKKECLERGKKLRKGDFIEVSHSRVYLVDYEIN